MKTAKSHNEPLKGKVEMEEDVMIQEMHFKDGRLDISATHPAFFALADEAARLLKDFGGKNYASFRMISKELGELVVDIRYADGMMPAEKAAQLELRVTTLESSLSRAQERLAGIIGITGQWILKRGDIPGCRCDICRIHRLATEDAKPSPERESTQPEKEG